MVHIPPHMLENNAHARGSAGIAWLESIPSLIDSLRRRWELEIGEPYSRLSYNFVVRARTSSGEPAVLKLGFPGDPETAGEMRALELYGGDGITRLLAADPDVGAMLVERLEPGRPLHTLCDEGQEIEIAAGLMRRLWRPVEDASGFSTVAGWGEAFERHRHEHGGGSGPLPGVIFDLGESLYRHLVATASQEVLLHGDFHHENVLSARREPWLAIDPKGLVGDPGFEVGTYLNNHWKDLYPGRDPLATLRFRVERFSALLAIDRERIVAWGIAFCVLSAVWSAENGGGGWREAISNAEALRTLLG